MDNLTHSLFGLTLARTPLRRAGRGAAAALLLASNAPDIDIVTTAGGALPYLQWHRGPTHGPLGVVGLASVVAAIVWAGDRWQSSRRGVRSDASWLALWGISIVGVLGHVLLDLPTSYGTRPLSPWSWHWYGLDWLPIVDVYLLALLGGGLWLGRTRSAQSAPSWTSGRVATATLVLMAGWYGVRGAAHAEAIRLAPRVLAADLAPACPDAVPPQAGLDAWPRAFEREIGRDRPAPCLLELAALPSFVSPWRWRLVARQTGGYIVSDVILGADASAAPARVRQVPDHWTPTAVTAAVSPLAHVFLGFSRFPATRLEPQADGSTSVHWHDLRFYVGDEQDSVTARRGSFRARVDVSASGAITRAELP